ncbi:MAG TPA: class I SAM-dependent methyltransferase [Thermoanaerobaculia bacterium]|nr:class I SAM-dependent methyltransferase [Thermoanaerobaculia bacterium]
MKTSITNRIRYVLDELLPRSLRESRWFMWPMFAIWFKGRHVRTAMDFKSLAPSLSDAEFREIYRNVQTLADDRPTDTHPDALAYVLSHIDADSRSLLDVGCGRGYFLQRAQEREELARVRLLGCDLRDHAALGRAGYVIGAAEHLPMRDRSVDVVTCSHTLEHMRRIDVVVAELARVAARRLFIIVPRQKYFRYTFDLHLQFFPTAEALERAIGLKGEILRFGDDWVYVVERRVT